MLTAMDPVTREVIQNRLISVVREMSVALQRAAYSPIIYEVKDFSSVLLRPDATVVAQAEGIPIFLGAMHQTLPPVLERYPLQDMQEGDIYVSNDPFTGNG
ncbi:MAG: N-methylhydantoinase, partial [Solirubrobacteraceae bacterium]|nr:N-methylhydantoinase [Solirubrobacteraceae bacterium]